MADRWLPNICVMYTAQLRSPGSLSEDRRDDLRLSYAFFLSLPTPPQIYIYIYITNSTILNKM